MTGMLTEFKKKLHIDHNHEKDSVRGLLRIGRFQDDPIIIALALEYVS